MRKAGDLINEFLREGRLAANRSQPIGAGSNAVVYASDVPGNVIKQSHRPDGIFAHRQTLEDEANLQAVAADMGIAPRVVSVEKFPGGIGNRIEMADARINFEPHGTSSEWPSGRDAVRVNQQLGELALRGVRLEDRHNGNVLYHKMTGRPRQIDFGVAGRVTGSDQVTTLANATAEGLEAAGAKEAADIYRFEVMDLLEGGDVTEAMKAAKRGFALLQKIK